MSTKAIDTISFPRLSNAYHVSYMSNFKVAIDKRGSEALGISEDSYERFSDNLALEQDIVNRSRASAYTVELLNLDTLRDNYFKRIWYKLRTAEYDSLNQAMTADLINTIKVNILKGYSLQITSDGNQVESAKIDGFIKDIHQYLNEDQIEALVIGEDLVILEKANDDYKKTYMKRLSENVNKAVTADCRAATESAYLQITYTLAATANSSSSDLATRTRIDLCAELIDEVNALIKDFKQKTYSTAKGEDDSDSDVDSDVDSDSVSDSVI